MLDFGPHGEFIVASYAVTAVVLCALIVWMYVEEKSQNKVLNKLEKQGLKRRSAQDN